MGIQVKPLTTLPLNLLITDPSEIVYPIAILKDKLGHNITGSPFTLNHAGNGLYINNTYVVKESDSYIYATYIVYNDPDHTVESEEFSRAEDVFFLALDPADMPNGIIDKINEIKSLILTVVDDGKITGQIDDESTDDPLTGLVNDKENITGFVDPT